MPTGNPEAFRFALPLDPEFIGVADDLSALYAGLAGAIARIAPSN